MTGSRLSKGTGSVCAWWRPARRGAALVSVAVLVLSLNGCGSDGSSSAAFGPSPGDTEEKITGFVMAPNGQFAAARRWWELPNGFGLVSAAYALIGSSPVGSGLPVSLSQLDSVDVSDGTIDSPQPLIVAALTDSSGRYTMIDPATEDVATCRKMLAVGSGETLTRALVYSHEVQVDATSEAMVRVVLDYIANSRSQLCDFTVRDLTNLYDKVFVAAFSAKGNDVAEINEAAYIRASNNQKVKEALAAGGMPG